MEIGEKREIEIYGEICCDMCNEIIHNHIDCPVCKKHDASTGNYHDLNECKDDGDLLICEECESKFKYISGDIYYDAEWERIE